MDPKVVTEMLDVIEGQFGDLMISRGIKYDLLGMKIEFNRKDKTIITNMKDQIEASFNMFGETLGKSVASSVNKNLLNTYGDKK